MGWMDLQVNAVEQFRKAIEESEKQQAKTMKQLLLAAAF